MVVNVDSNALSLAQALAGAGVSVSNATLNCAGHATGTFSAIPQTLPIPEGVVLTTGRAADVVPSSVTANWANYNFDGDPDLLNLIGDTLPTGYDACALEFDMTVSGDSVSFDYVFGSMEYNEWASSEYNDVFAFFISGPGYANPVNIALVPGTNNLVRVGTVNCDSNSQYYVCNTAYDPWNLYLVPCAPGICPTDSFPWLMQYDGHTTVFTAKAAVQPCQTYHLKLAIMDRGDPWLDAGVFLRKASINSNAAVITAEVDFTDDVFGEATAVEGCIDGRFRIELTNPADTVTTITFGVGGTAQQGSDYATVPAFVTFQPGAGETVQYVNIDVIADGVTDPDEFVFLYQFSACNGLPIDTTILYITDVFSSQTVADTGVCVNEPVFLSVNGGAGITYNWTPASGLTCATCQYPFATPDVNTTYTVVISSPGGCTASDEVVISINPDSAYAGADQVVCGLSAELSGSDAMGTQITWAQVFSSSNGMSSFDSVNVQTTNVNVTIPGTYRYTYTVGNACQNTDTVEVIFASPGASVQPGDTGVCPGSCVTLNAVTGTPQTFFIDANLPIPDGDWDGVYSNLELNGYCTDSLSLDDIVGITINIDHETVSDVKVVLNAPNGDAVILAYDNGTILDEDFTNTTFSPSATVSINNAAAPFTGTFLPYGSFNSIAGAPMNGTWSLWVTDLWGAGSGSEGTLLNWSIAFNTNTYAWSPSAGLSATNIASPEACPTQPTTYTVTVTNDCGCADTATAVVNTSGGLGASISALPASCNQSDGEVSTDASNGTPPFSYVWNTGDTTDALFNVSSGVYTVTITDATGCNAVLTDTVLSSDGPVVNGLVADALCNGSGGSITLSVNGGTAPYTFSWSNGSTDQNADSLTAGDYSVTVSDASSCSVVQLFTVLSSVGVSITAVITDADCNVANGLVDINVSGGATPYLFLWSTGATTEDLTNTSSGFYSVTVSDVNGCSISDTIQVENSNGPQASFTTTEPDCSGSNGSIDLTVSGGTGPYVYEWSNGMSMEDAANIGSGTYTVTITDINLCTLLLEIVLTPQSASVITLNGLVDTVCAGQSFNVSASGFNDYTWSPSAGLSSTSGNNIVVTPDVNSTYTITGSDPNGCSDTTVFSVTVIPGASVLFEQTFNGCSPLSVTLEAGVQNADAVLWWIDGIPTGNGNPVQATLGEGTHDVVVVASSVHGCNDTAAAAGFAVVYASPPAVFESQPAGGNTYNFINQSGSDLQFLWQFGDGTQDTASNPVHSFPGFGSYSVVLTATNAHGCSDTAQKIITAVVPPDVFIPNTFSPNGDGINDFFGLYSSAIRKYRLEIYDRWGERIFDGEGNPVWDGTFKGNHMNMSTFVYITEVEFLDGFKRVFTGDINLLR